MGGVVDFSEYEGDSKSSLSSEFLVLHKKMLTAKEFLCDHQLLYQCERERVRGNS